MDARGATVSSPFLFEVIMHIEVLEENIDLKTILEEANSVKMFLDAGWKDIYQVGLQSHKPDLKPSDEWNKSIGRLDRLQYPEIAPQRRQLHEGGILTARSSCTCSSTWNTI